MELSNLHKKMYKCKCIKKCHQNPVPKVIRLPILTTPRSGLAFFSAAFIKFDFLSQKRKQSERLPVVYKSVSISLLRFCKI